MNTALTPAETAALKKEILSSLHCALPGTVESYDADTQTAAVRPALKMPSRPEQSGTEGSHEYPLLRDVPVFMPVPFDVSPGDSCLLIFADRDIDAWFETGEAAEPASNRMHSLSDAFALVGFRAGRRMSS